MKGGDVFRHNKIERLTSDLGQKQTSGKPAGCPLCPRKRTSEVTAAMSALGHVWTAPGWQEESSLCSDGRSSHMFGLFTRFT